MNTQLLLKTSGSATRSFKALHIALLTFAICLVSNQIFAQAATASWALTGNAAGSSTGLITASAMTTPLGTPSFSLGTGAAIDGWNQSATLDPTDYYEYKLTPNTGNMFQMNSISFFLSFI